MTYSTGPVDIKNACQKRILAEGHPLRSRARDSATYPRSMASRTLLEMAGKRTVQIAGFLAARSKVGNVFLNSVPEVLLGSGGFDHTCGTLDVDWEIISCARVQKAPNCREALSFCLGRRE
jgi:hypothetical protein